jgi:hypothetical protein
MGEGSREISTKPFQFIELASKNLNEAILLA